MSTKSTTRRPRYETTLSTTAKCVRCGHKFIPRSENYRHPLPFCPSFRECICIICGGGAIETHTPVRRAL